MEREPTIEDDQVSDTEDPPPEEVITKKKDGFGPWNRFYNSIEDDLESDNPTKKVKGAAKRLFIRAAYAAVVSALLASVVWIAAWFITPFFDLQVVWAGVFGLTFPLVFATMYTGWLPGSGDTSPPPDSEENGTNET